MARTVPFAGSMVKKIHVRGVEQSTDKAFANYLNYSKASLAEVLGRLEQAHLKRHLTTEELRTRATMGEELGKMLGGFIKYLRGCDWKKRGRYKPIRD